MTTATTAPPTPTLTRREMWDLAAKARPLMVACPDGDGALPCALCIAEALLQAQTEMGTA